jgi:hypothetical protein
MQCVAVSAGASRVGRRAGGIDWIVLCHLLLLFCAGSWDRSGIVLRPPSPAFVNHDIDQDHWISREEWESRYGTRGGSGAVLEFDGGDCDRDGRLSWQEFYGVSVRHRPCARSPLAKLHQQPSAAALDPDLDALIVSDRDLQLARVSLARTRQRLVAAKFHEHYTEQDWPTGAMYRHALACGEPEEIEIPEMSRDFSRLSQLAELPRGRRSAMRCSLANHSRRTFTYMQLRVSMSGDESVETFHGKTLWVPPQEARDFWILPETGLSVTGVSVLGVRIAHD